MVGRAVACSASLFCIILVITYSSFPQSNLVDGKGKSVCPTMLQKLLGEDKACNKLKCETKITANTCPEGTEFKENVASCGCCPACVRYEELKEFDECVGPTYEECTEKVCPVVLPTCGAGLVCSSKSNTCVKLDPSAELTCDIKYAMAKDDKLHWTPSCNPDGSYGPRQCKGVKDTTNAMCFCTDKKGQRIFGRKKWTDASANMTCACSLHANTLRESGQISTLHCTSDGNYESLQCDSDSGLCYCVNPKSGKLTGAVLPEALWKDLPCYSNSLGDNYLRRCESLWAATERIRREALLHGLDLSLYPTVDACDYDGSYKRFHDRSTTHNCEDKDGKTIGSYFRASGSAGAEVMTCNCAREPSEYADENLPWTGKKCDNLGNFETVLESGSLALCIDGDGFIYQNVTVGLICCLDSSCGNEVREKCYPTNPTGPKDCTIIPT